METGDKSFVLNSNLNKLLKLMHHWIILLIMITISLMSLLIHLILNEYNIDSNFMVIYLIINAAFIMYHFIIGYLVNRFLTLFSNCNPLLRHARWVDYVVYYLIAFIIAIGTSLFIIWNVIGPNPPLLFDFLKQYAYIQLAIYGLLPFIFTCFIVIKVHFNKIEYSNPLFRMITWVFSFILLIATTIPKGDIYFNPIHELLFMVYFILLGSLVMILLSLNINKKANRDVNLPLLQIFIYSILLCIGNLVNLIDRYPQGTENLYIILSLTRMLLAFWILSTLLYQNYKVRFKNLFNVFNIISLIHFLMVTTLEILTLYFIHYNQIRQDGIYYFIFPANISIVSFFVGFEILIIIGIKYYKKEKNY